MKIRSGFVSNSSSSSFLLRGVKLKIVDLAKRLGENPTQTDLYAVLSSKFGYGKGKVNIESTRYYFSEDDYNTKDVIVGVLFASLSDGEVVEVKDPNDVSIKPKIENIIGKIGELKTYIQFVSNDNY